MEAQGGGRIVLRQILGKCFMRRRNRLNLDSRSDVDVVEMFCCTMLILLLLLQS
jgi:hypothetical protein